MQQSRISAKALVVGSALFLSSTCLAPNAEALSGSSADRANQHTPRAAASAGSLGSRGGIAPTTAHPPRAPSAGIGQPADTRARQVARLRPVAVRGAGISCVPYARIVSGINLSGNAWQWWGNAAGSYARGRTPEVRAILSFRSNPVMRLGHVAVVSNIVNARHVLIDHSNWASGSGAVARNIGVIDVSEDNDWSAVRVQIGRSNEFGAIYPTHGFIYDRPDTGMITAALSEPTQVPVLNPVPRDLRPQTARARASEEVAEAPARASQPASRTTRHGWVTITHITSRD
jgi:CHAP domain